MNPLDIDISSRTVATGIASVGTGLYVLIAPMFGMDASMVETAPEILIIAGFTIIYGRMAKGKNGS